MSGLFTGIIGSLIGAGIQATVGGIQIQENTSKALDVLRGSGLPLPPANWFLVKSSSEQRTEQVCDQIGQYVSGAMQILGPCMQFAKALEDVHPRSQPVSAKARTPHAELAQSTAFHKSAGVNNSAALLLPGVTAGINNKKECDSKSLRSCEISSREFVNRAKKSADNLEKSSFSNDFYEAAELANVRSEGNLKNRANSSVKDKMLRTINRKTVKTGPRERATKKDFMVKVEKSNDLKCHPSCRSSMVTNQSSQSQIKLFKPQNKNIRSDKTKLCQICQAQIRKTKKILLIPCEHVDLCYSCLKNRKLLKCPKCGMKFN